MPKQSTGPRLVKRKGRPNFFIRFIDPKDGIQKDRSTGTRDGIEAQEALADFLNENRASRSSPALPPYRVPVAEVLDRYHAHLNSMGCGDRAYYSIVHLLAFWEESCVDSITQGRVDSYVVQNARKVPSGRIKRDKKGDDKADNEPEKILGRSRSTLRRELTDLRSAINFAVQERVVYPIVFPKLPREGPSRTRVLKRDEFDTLLAEADKDPRAAEALTLFLFIAYYTGARRGAIMDLRWDDVDFAENTIDYRIPDKGELEVDRKPRALTPMAPPLQKHLLARFNAYEEVPEFVFQQNMAPESRVRSVAKSFRSAAKRCGFKDVVPHTLRHSCVSNLRNKGVLAHVVKDFLAMSEVTQNKVYNHADQKLVQEAAECLA
jgi:integrase